MNNDSFAIYYAKCQRYCAKLYFNDDAILNRLNHNLNNAMKDALIYLDSALTFNARIAQYQFLNGCIRGRCHKAKCHTTNFTHHTNTTTITTTKTLIPAVHPTSSNSGYYGFAFMDILSRRCPLSSEEDLRRMCNRVCLYSCQTAYVSNACSASARAKSFQAHLATLMTTEPPTSKDEESTDTRRQKTSESTLA